MKQTQIPTAIEALMTAVRDRLRDKNQVVERVRVSGEFRQQLAASIPRSMAVIVLPDGEFEIDGIKVAVDKGLPRGVSFAISDEDCT